MKQGFIYIVSNSYNTTFYTGVTANLTKRVTEHKSGKGSRFTIKYKLHKLVYYEVFESMLAAIVREKQIKDMNRKDKIKLIRVGNPAMKDLWSEIIQRSL